MSDAIIAEISRRLASALMKRAHSRSTDDTKLVAQLDTELCAAVKAESNEEPTSTHRSS